MAKIQSWIDFPGPMAKHYRRRMSASSAAQPHAERIEDNAFHLKYTTRPDPRTSDLAKSIR